MKMSESLGRRVMASADASEIGEVKAYVVDQPPRRITALHVAGRKSKPELIDWSHVVGFGPDAVMIDAKDNLRGNTEDDDREEDMVRRDVDLIGSTVIDVRGYENGEVTDVIFDETNGIIESLVIKDGLTESETTLPISEVYSVGSFATITTAR